MKFFFFAMLVLISMSFTNRPEATFKSGTFGVCNCGEKTNAIIELKFNEDHTFSYIDKSEKDKAINTSGTWEISGNKIHLKNYKSSFPINKTWKLEKKYPCINSVKGLEFTRLCGC